MGKTHSIELRERVVAFVDEGNSHRDAARHFRVLPKFVNDMVKLGRETGALLAKPQGNLGRTGKLNGLSAWVRERLAAQGDLTLDELCLELVREHGVMTSRSSVGRWLQRLRLSHKKTLLASEQHRPDVALRRQIWITWRQPFMGKALERLGFIDESSLNTKMVKTSGWAPIGERLIDFAPFGHWNTQTFIAGLRHDGLTAPWVIDGPINRRRFETYIETQLVPTLTPGDVVTLDNLSSHKSAKAAQDLKTAGAWFVFLPQYSPDLNPIEMAFAKLKTLTRKAAARTYEDLWRAVGDVCGLFTEQECLNFFNAAVYEAN